MKRVSIALGIVFVVVVLFFILSNKNDKYKTILKDYGKKHEISFTFDIAKSGKKLERIQKQISQDVTYYFKATAPGMLVNIVEFSDENITAEYMKKTRSTQSKWYLMDGRFLIELIEDDLVKKIDISAVLAPNSLLSVISCMHNAGLTINNVIIVDFIEKEKIATKLDVIIENLYNIFVVVNNKICQVNLIAGSSDKLLSAFIRFGADSNNLIALPSGIIEVVVDDDGSTAAKIRDIVMP